MYLPLKLRIWAWHISAFVGGISLVMIDDGEGRDKLGHVIHNSCHLCGCGVSPTHFGDCQHKTTILLVENLL